MPTLGGGSACLHAARVSNGALVECLLKLLILVISGAVHTAKAQKRKRVRKPPGGGGGNAQQEQQGLLACVPLVVSDPEL